MNWNLIFDKLKDKMPNIDTLTDYYPEKQNIFKAFELTPFQDIKIVILGQDCYYSECVKTKQPYATGLAFSVPKECTIPKTLQNIFKKLKDETNVDNKHGDLTAWAKQGILLLNTQLTVQKGKPNTHKFWNRFTDAIIREISTELDNVVFVLWGTNAMNKQHLIDKRKHHVIITSHPSPLSCYRKLKNYSSFNEFGLFSEIEKWYYINWKN